MNVGVTQLSVVFGRKRAQIKFNCVTPRTFIVEFIPGALPSCRASQLVWDGYLAGLAAAGWRGDERVVRFGYAASLALGYSFMPRWMLALAADETRHAILEQQFNRPIEDVLERRAAVVRLALERGDEARALCAELLRQRP